MEVFGKLSSIILTYFITICAANSDFFSLVAKDINGNDFHFETLKGKAVLVLNVASECGFTDSHYKQLVKLYTTLRSSGKFEIIAFPCNQFGAQEPGKENEILVNPGLFNEI